MIPADSVNLRQVRDAPARAGAVRADREKLRRVPEGFGRAENLGYVAAEFGRLTENVGVCSGARGVRGSPADGKESAAVAGLPLTLLESSIRRGKDSL